MLQEELEEKKGIAKEKNLLADNDIISGPPPSLKDNIISGPPPSLKDNIISGPPPSLKDNIISGHLSNSNKGNNILSSPLENDGITSGAPAYSTEPIPLLGTINNYNLKVEPLHCTSYKQVIYVYMNGKMEKNFRTVTEF